MIDPYVRFEIRHYSDGTSDKNLPCIVWVDCMRPLRAIFGSPPCRCDGPFYPIKKLPDGLVVSANTPANAVPSVCLCMGGFVTQ